MTPTNLTELGAAADLRYIPPPAAPLLALHPSRMTMAQTAATGLSALRPDRSANDLRARLRAWSGHEGCVLTTSGRAALRLALLSRGAGPDTEVVVSTFNCPAVADAVLACGARPVFVDFDPATGPAFGSVPLAGRIVVLTNGLGLDEWTAHARRITERGGEIVLDLAQAVPAPGLLRRYIEADCPTVLSFGEGKPLGGLGGGALLTPARLPDDAGPALSVGVGALVRAMTERALLHAPVSARSAAVRRQLRAPGWSTTKANHLPIAPEPVLTGGPGRWELAAAAAMLDAAERVRFAMTRLHDQVRILVEGSLSTCFLSAATPDLCPNLDLIFERRGHRLRFGRELAALGVPATWNYYPLHRTPAYASAAAMPSAERLWPRVLSLPKLPQPRLTADRLAHAILTADRATARDRRA